MESGLSEVECTCATLVVARHSHRVVAQILRSRRSPMRAKLISLLELTPDPQGPEAPTRVVGVSIPRADCERATLLGPGSTFGSSRERPSVHQLDAQLRVDDPVLRQIATRVTSIRMDVVGQTSSDRGMLLPCLVRCCDTISEVRASLSLRDRGDGIS